MTINIENLYHVYPGAVEALRGIDLTIPTGETVLLMGHNGAGKSTLLKHLNGILKPTHGDVFIGETNTKDYDVADLARHVAMSFQNPDDQIFSSTVFEEVAFGPKNLEKETILELTEEALHLLNLQGIASSHPYDLHPSKRKFLTIASAIAMDTPIVAFDEPSAGLDVRQRKLLREALETLKARKKTVIIVSHDIDMFLQICDSVVVIATGKIVFRGATDDLAAQPDLRAILRRSGLSFPVLWRMARALGFETMPSTAEEFANLWVERKRL